MSDPDAAGDQIADWCAKHSEKRETTIPPDQADTVERIAKQRAASLNLPWDELSEAHQTGIKQTIWAEFNWL